MPYVYFPGCIFTAQSPEASERMKRYLSQNCGVTVTGCCRANYSKLSQGDTALIVCPTCLFNLQKNAPNAHVLSLWEVLADDNAFPWPDYRGDRITMQDCIDTRSNPGWQQAARRVLKRMNASVVEIAASFEKADFCNIETMKSDETIQQRRQRLTSHCEEYTTDTVACYCTGCRNSLRIAGVNGVHLLDMVTAGLE